MLKKTLFILFFVLLLPVSLIYASGDEISLDSEKMFISNLSDDEIKNAIEALSEKNYNESAIEAVKKHIFLFTGKIKEKFSLWLSRSGKYIELMKDILKQNNIPEEIVFLPLIESGFNPNAYSPARAVGYWQFIASTAKRYGLEINWWRDERKDPVKSTIAAANYLRDLYNMFGSWNLAMAAYNAGEGKIIRALSKSKVDDYWELLNTRYIKSETKNYVPKFIAASLIANSPEYFGFDNLEYHNPLDFDYVTLDSPVDLEVAARCAETDVQTIKELNPELRRWCTPPDVTEYNLRIPAGKKRVFLENLLKIPKEERFSIDIYKVKKGDTIKKISKMKGIPEHVILDLNNLEKIIPLKEGMTIYIPPKDKLTYDTDDRYKVKKITYKYKKIKKSKSKKIKKA